jgi:NAD(P)-dependent dehydrogenase (short-subunit alcohol dehydrogenase family)
VLGGRTEGPLRALSEEIGGHVITFDARDFDATHAAVEQVEARYGRLDGVVNLAGAILLKAAHTTSAAEWDHVLGANLRTAFSVVRAAAPALGRSGGGSLVLVSSAAARIGLANHEAVAAAKAGVAGLATSAAATYAPRGVRVNVVSPGLVRTPLAERIVANEAALRTSQAMHALGRIGEPDDVARVLEFLLDPAQSWITGQAFGVDGGLGTVRSR